MTRHPVRFASLSVLCRLPSSKVCALAGQRAYVRHDGCVSTSGHRASSNPARTNADVRRRHAAVLEQVAVGPCAFVPYLTLSRTTTTQHNFCPIPSHSFPRPPPRFLHSHGIHGSHGPRSNPHGRHHVPTPSKRDTLDVRGQRTELVSSRLQISISVVLTRHRWSAGEKEGAASEERLLRYAHHLRFLDD